MQFWDEESLESEIMEKYAPVLKAIGVDCSRDEIQDAIEAYAYNLENSLRAAISYSLWLYQRQREVIPNLILMRALREQWQPINWRDDYLNIQQIQIIKSKKEGERWLNGATQIWGVDTKNRLVKDIVFDGGKEFIRFRNGKELLVDTAWKLGWEKVFAYAKSDMRY